MWFEQAIARDPRRIDGLLQRGYGALDRKDFTAARADFVRAAEVARDSAEVDWAFAMLAEAEGDWDTVLEHSITAMRRAPDWVEAITDRLQETAKKLYGPAPQRSEAILNRLRSERGPDYEAQYRNRIGNLRYWHSDYGAAASSYRAAAAVRPDVAQYWANLAMALERAATSDGRYDEALKAVAAALEIEPHNADYTVLYDRLVGSSRFVDRFGPAAARLLPDTYRIRVLVPRSLLPQVAKESSLLPELQECVSALRDALKRDYGFVLCGVSFRDLDPAYDPHNTLIIEIGGERVLERPNVGIDTNLMSVLGPVIRARLPLAFGHDEARACAESCPEHSEVEDDPARLNGLTHAIRRWLADHDDLPDDALAEMVGRAEPLVPQIEHTTAGPAPSLLLLHAPDVTITDDIFPHLQANVFRRTGVVMPLLPHQAKGDLKAGTLRLSIGESTHELPVEDPWPVAQHLLAERAADLFEADALSFGMQHLRTEAPALVTVAEGLLPGDALLAALRLCVRDGRSIINLRTTLEQTLLPPLSGWSPIKVQAALAQTA
jgi:tetratricopeptide (TPR) repeat protein